MIATELKIGQKVHCILYGGRDGIICDIKGRQSPNTVGSIGGCISFGGYADIDVVFEDGNISRGVPESIVRGVQWRIYDMATREELEKALMFAQAKKIKDEALKKLKAQQVIDDTERYKKEFSYLKQAEPGKYADNVLAAKNIRIELKKHFPEIKFSVRSASFSGGDDIRISWKNGVPAKDVEEIVNKYEQGSFDGMTDSYNYSEHRTFTDLFGGTKYLFCDREIGNEWYLKCFEYVKNHYEHGATLTDMDSYSAVFCNYWNCNNPRNLMYRMLQDQKLVDIDSFDFGKI